MMGFFSEGSAGLLFVVCAAAAAAANDARRRQRARFGDAGGIAASGCRLRAIAGVAADKTDGGRDASIGLDLGADESRIGWLGARRVCLFFCVGKTTSFL